MTPLQIQPLRDSRKDVIGWLNLICSGFAPLS